MMKEILAEHKKRYPGMEVRDVVKLLYQSEFGNGHMVTEPGRAMEQLEREYQKVQKHQGTGKARNPAVEHIGGGYCRVYLNQLPEGLSLKTLNRLFILSAGPAQDDINPGTDGDSGLPARRDRRSAAEAMENQLNRFSRWTREGITGFSEAEVESYLAEYRHQGYPAVSHSEHYRRLYQPAYRVIAEAYARRLSLFADIDQMLAGNGNDAVLVAIDGQCASGKTTLAALVQQVYDCNVFHMDDFFLPPWLRTPERLAEVGGNVDYERFRRQVLEPLRQGAAVRYQIYDCGQQQLTAWVEVPARRLNLVEGAYSCHPYFGSCYHLTYCLTVDAKEQKRRILKRNGEAMLKRFVEEWIPKENAYLEQFGIRKE